MTPQLIVGLGYFVVMFLISWRLAKNENKT